MCERPQLTHRIFICCSASLSFVVSFRLRTERVCDGRLWSTLESLAYFSMIELHTICIGTVLLRYDSVARASVTHIAPVAFACCRYRWYFGSNCVCTFNLQLVVKWIQKCFGRLCFPSASYRLRFVSEFDGEFEYARIKNYENFWKIQTIQATRHRMTRISIHSQVFHTVSNWTLTQCFPNRWKSFCSCDGFWVA